MFSAWVQSVQITPIQVNDRKLLSELLDRVSVSLYVSHHTNRDSIFPVSLSVGTLAAVTCLQHVNSLKTYKMWKLDCSIYCAQQQEQLLFMQDLTLPPSSSQFLFRERPSHSWGAPPSLSTPFTEIGENQCNTNRSAKLPRHLKFSPASLCKALSWNNKLILHLN